MRTRVLVSLTGLAVGAGLLSAVPAGGEPTPIAREQQAPVAGHPCRFPPKAQCGHVRVPRDPADPAAGAIRLRYELFPAQRRPARGTIVAVEGGPGYSTTSSRAYYRDLLGPLLKHRRLLLVDNRGTGMSEPIRCRQLQRYEGSYEVAVGRCGRQLGRFSDVYGTAFAVRDLVAVLDRLHIRKVDLYGDSYGTFFSQAFAVRHPERLRTLILDAIYFVSGDDPWYSDTNRALRNAFTLACRRSPTCHQRPGATMRRIARLAAKLRHQPLRGYARNADGGRERAVADVDALIDIVNAAATTPSIYRELDAAARAALRPHPYVRPLLRLVAETSYEGGAGRVRWWSEGLYAAVSCNDYPQAFDIMSPRARRPAQLERSVRHLVRQRPRIFAPFRVREWVGSPYGYFDDCLRWPVPSRWVPAVPAPADFPDVPTLVLAGDLDSLTSPEGARQTARAFPRSTFVRVANMTHVSALVDFDQCASRIVRRFVRTKQAGDTSCARDYHENRLVDRYARTMAGLGWGNSPRATARATAATLGDVMARWLSMYGSRGVGLSGGRFTVHGGYFAGDDPVVTWRLDEVRWVRDVAVSGRMTWTRRTGAVVAKVRVSAPAAVTGPLRLRWNDLDRYAQATAHWSGHQWSFPAP